MSVLRVRGLRVRGVRDVRLKGVRVLRLSVRGEGELVRVSAERRAVVRSKKGERVEDEGCER